MDISNTLSATFHGAYSTRTSLQYWCYALLGIATVFIAARTYTRIISPKKIGADDVFALAAWLAQIALAVSIWEDFHHGLGLHSYDLLSRPDGMESLAEVAKWIWIIHIIGPVITSLVKASIICLYLRLASTPQQRLALKILLVLDLLEGLATLLTVSFACVPLKHIPTGSDSSCADMKYFSIFNAVWQIATNLVLAAAPALVLKNLQMDRRNRLFLTVMFGLGALVMVGTIGRQIIIFTIDLNSNDSVWPVTVEIVWTVVEISLGTIFLCLPPLAPYLTRLLVKLDILTCPVTCPAEESDSNHKDTPLIESDRPPTIGRATTRKTPQPNNDDSLFFDNTMVTAMERTILEVTTPEPTKAPQSERTILEVTIPEPAKTPDSERAMLGMTIPEPVKTPDSEMNNLLVRLYEIRDDLRRFDTTSSDLSSTPLIIPGSKRSSSRHSGECGSSLKYSGSSGLGSSDPSSRFASLRRSGLQVEGTVRPVVYRQYTELKEDIELGEETIARSM